MQINEEKKIKRKQKIARVFSIVALLVAFLTATFALKEMPREAHAMNNSWPTVSVEHPLFGGGRYYSEQELSSLGYLNNSYTRVVSGFGSEVLSGRYDGIEFENYNNFIFNDISDDEELIASQFNDNTRIIIHAEEGFENTALTLYYYLPQEEYDFLFSEQTRSRTLFLKNNSVYQVAGLPIPDNAIIWSFVLHADIRTNENQTDYEDMSSYPYFVEFRFPNIQNDGSVDGMTDEDGWFSFNNLQIHNNIISGSYSQHINYDYTLETGYANIPLVFNEANGNLRTRFKFNGLTYGNQYEITTTDFQYNNRIVDTLEYLSSAQVLLGYNRTEFKALNYFVDARENIVLLSSNPVVSYEDLTNPSKQGVEISLPIYDGIVPDEPSNSPNFFERLGDWLRKNWTAIVGGIGGVIIGGLVGGPAGAVIGGIAGFFGLNALLGNLGLGGLIFDNIGVNAAFSIIFVVFIVIILISILRK